MIEPSQFDARAESMTLEELRAAEESEYNRQRSGEPIVYFIECVGIPAVKIGWTTNIRKRLGSHQISCPLPLRVVATVPGGEEREREFHCQFKSLHMHGEWFRLADELKEYLEANLSVLGPRYSLEKERRELKFRALSIQLEHMFRKLAPCSPRHELSCAGLIWSEKLGSGMADNRNLEQIRADSILRLVTQ